MTLSSVRDSALVCLLCLATAPYASADQTVAQKAAVVDDARLPTAARSSLASEKFTGLPVRARGGEEVGKVRDFVVDARTGYVLFTVVGSGGMAGIGETLRAVPTSALQRSDRQEGFDLTMERARWEEAPPFDGKRLDTLAWEQRGRALFDFYGAKPDEAGETGGMPQLLLASSLDGKDVSDGERSLGKAEDLIVDFNSRRSSVLLDAAGDAAAGGDAYVVPLQQLQVAADGETITTRLRRADLERAKPFDQMAWSGGDTHDVYRWDERSVEVGAYLSTESVPQVGTPGPSLAARSGSPATPEGTLERIRTAVQQDIALAGSVHNVTVEEAGEGYRLRGTVRSEEIKQRIGERATQTAAGAEIENAIEVDAR